MEVFIILLILVSVVVSATLLVWGLHNQARRRYLETSLENLENKYSPVVDAEERATEILQEAQQQFNAAKNRAHQGLKNAEQKAKDIIQNANEQAERAKSAATQFQEILDNANREASSILTHAERQAEIIIKNAQIESDNTRWRTKHDAESIKQTAEAVARHTRSQAEQDAEKIVSTAIAEAQEKTKSLTRQVKQLTTTADALRNKIEGYDVEYIIPGIGLLDGLAVDYGHTEAGQNLKAIRADVRKMVREGKTARCREYKGNEEQQNTALAFVTGVFNGTVDEILSRVRSDNYGVLAQEIRDAAILVNRGTTVLANTKIEILPDYINSRLNELKCATIVHELKMREREEQRTLNEQIREEKKVQKEIEKARKEAEKARRDAEKGIEREQKIYDELRAKFATMSEKERTEAEAKHAQEIAEIQERLRLAEEKGQRALSMAQQTKQGHIYIISNIGSFGENVYKIGMTRRLDPTERVRELGDASVPFPFDIHGMIQFQDCPTAEKQLHRLFVMSQVNKTNFRKEFFRVNLSDIKMAIEKLGGEAHWTMLAEAAQYRETLRIEERIQTDEVYRQKWTDRQIRLEEMSVSTWDEEE